MLIFLVQQVFYIITWSKAGQVERQSIVNDTHRYFFHQILDLADHLVSVGLVNIGAEGDLPLLAGLRYGRDTEHGHCDNTLITGHQSKVLVYNDLDITTTLLHSASAATTARHGLAIKCGRSLNIKSMSSSGLT